MPSYWVTASADDAAEQYTSGAVDNSGLGYTLNTGVNRGYFGCRFLGIQLAKDQTIYDARLALRGSDAKLPDLDLDIYAEAIDSSVAFGTTTNEISTRTRTTAFVTWQYTYGSTDWAESPNIVAVINEVTARAGWLPGNALTLICVARSALSCSIFAWDAVPTGEFPARFTTDMNAQMSGGDAGDMLHT